MPRKTTRNAQGSGTIRKKTATRSGKEYTYWEARITVGRDPGTGKQIQRSITGKTQKEVREKLAGAVVEVDRGAYQPTNKITRAASVAEHLLRPQGQAADSIQLFRHDKEPHYPRFRCDRGTGCQRRPRTALI